MHYWRGAEKLNIRGSPRPVAAATATIFRSGIVSPEPALHTGEWALDSTTKSPHTNRVIKRGKTATIASGSSQETTITAPDCTHATHVNAAQPVTTTLTPFAFVAQPLGLINRILEQIQSSLDMAAQITPNTDTTDVQPLVVLIQHLLDTLMTTATDSIARSDNRPQNAARATHLVVDFTSEDHPQPPADLASLAEICTALNQFLPDIRAVKAVTRTCAGNWVLHTDPAQCDAYALIEHGPRILELRSRLEPNLWFTKYLIMFPAEPWYTVVIHGIPQNNRHSPQQAELLGVNSTEWVQDDRQSGRRTKMVVAA
ncbi:hypothetical protein C8R45DRAFT_1078700 [Mycena sanguinolenta]|nr:hypothetical protein C8R45DRAFT_1078700 [Mycena sanguinolenta]